MSCGINFPNNGMTPEAEVDRRALMVEILTNLKGGIRLPKFQAPPRERAPRPSRAKAPWKYATEEERAQARRNTSARVYAKAQEGIKAGLRPKPVLPSSSRASLYLPVGLWVTVNTRGGLERTLKVLAPVPAGEAPVLPAGSAIKHGRDMEPTRLPRYVMGLPPVDAMDRPPVILAGAAELEDGLVKVHPEAPEELIGRLVVPLPKGARVNWVSQGAGKTQDRHGDVVAFVPAGQSYQQVLRDHRLTRLKTPSGHTNSDVSIRDRYIVRVGKFILVPAAYLIERPILNQRKEKAA